MKFHWYDRRHPFVFGEKPQEKDRLRIAKQSHRVVSWWKDLPRHHEALRELMNDTRIKELTREVTMFWYEWFLYEHLSPCDEQRDWASSMRDARLHKIRALARRCGSSELVTVNRVVLRASLPWFGVSEEGVRRAEEAHQQFQAEGYWWPFDIPFPGGDCVSRPPDWRTVVPIPQTM